MRRTTCCEFLGCFRRGIREGSKSGGKYLLRTASRMVSALYKGGGLIVHLFVPPLWILSGGQRESGSAGSAGWALVRSWPQPRN
jgi:hypothetical protein